MWLTFTDCTDLEKKWNRAAVEVEDGFVSRGIVELYSRYLQCVKVNSRWRQMSLIWGSCWEVNQFSFVHNYLQLSILNVLFSNSIKSKSVLP